MKDVRPVMKVDLLQHSFDGAFALFIDGKRTLYLAPDTLRQFKGAIPKHKGCTLYRFADRSREATNVLQQVSVNPAQIIAIRKRIGDVFKTI